LTETREEGWKGEQSGEERRWQECEERKTGRDRIDG